MNKDLAKLLKEEAAARYKYDPNEVRYREDVIREYLDSMLIVMLNESDEQPSDTEVDFIHNIKRLASYREGSWQYKLAYEYSCLYTDMLVEKGDS